MERNVHEAKVAHTAGAYPGFCSMKQLKVLLLPSGWDARPSQGYPPQYVDFRKAFDSVWHDGLLYKLLQINVRGNFYNLIKSLYSNSTSIKIGNNRMRPFRYARGVRQGCILSPLLFKLNR